MSGGDNLARKRAQRCMKTGIAFASSDLENQGLFLMRIPESKPSFDLRRNACTTKACTTSSVP